MGLNVVDVSSNNPINAAITAGADGCIVKATQGKDYVNPSCDAQYQLAKAHGLKLGVYHYGGGNDAAVEADFFLKNVAGYIHEAILILDWEENQNSNYGDSNWCRRFVNHVHEKTGVWCLIYGNRQDINRCTNLVNDCGLWFAGYPTDTQRDWNAPDFMYDTTPWATLVGWQYSAADVDRSKFYITKEQWDAYAKGKSVNPASPVPPTPVDPTKAGDHLSTLDDGKAKAHLDRFGPLGDKLIVEGWHTFVCEHEYIFILDRVTGKELARKEVQALHRPDVKKAFGLSYDEVGFQTEFDLKSFRGHSVIAMMRGTDNREGNPSANWDDLTETRWYHDIK